MGLFLKPASETDFPRIVEILAAANAQDPWMRIMKPGQPPPRARVKTIDRFLNEHLNDPVVEYMAVEDSEQNELIAFARWNMYRKERPDDEWKKEPNIQWDEGTNEEAAATFIRGIFEKRQSIMNGKAHLLLNMLDTHPDHQRRGAGRMLLKWGIDIADKAGLPIYLEAAPAGVKLYGSMGFAEVDKFDIDMATWGGEGIHRHVLMIRPAKSV